MSTVILRGEEAVHYAEIHHLALHCDADEEHGAMDGLSLDEARIIADEHPELLWVELHLAVNTGESSEHH